MENLETKTKFITLAQAAKRTGYTPEYLNLLSRQGTLLAQKIGRNWFVDEKHLQSFEAWVHSASYPKPGRKKNHTENSIQPATPIQVVAPIQAKPVEVAAEEPIGITSLPIFKERLTRFAFIFLLFWGVSVGLAYLLAHGQTKVSTQKQSTAILSENPIFNPQTFATNYQEKVGEVLAALNIPPKNLFWELNPHTKDLASGTSESLPFGVGVNQQYFPDNSQVSEIFSSSNSPQSAKPKIAGAEKTVASQAEINPHTKDLAFGTSKSLPFGVGVKLPPLSTDAWKFLFLVGAALLSALLIFWFFHSIHKVFLQPVGVLGWIGLVIFSLISSLTLNQFIHQTVEPEINNDTQFNNSFAANSKKGVKVLGEEQTQEALITADNLNARLFDYVLKDSLKKNQTLAGDVYLNWNDKLKLERNTVKSREIVRHAIEAEDIDTSSITSRTIRNHTIQGEDIDPNTDVTLNSLNVATFIDLGTNTIADGNFVGDWDFNGGSLTTTGTLNAGATTLSGNLDMQNNIIQNIGSANTDFTATGGLNLAGDLDVNGLVNDIAGTLNLSGNALTASGLLTITPTAGLTVNTNGPMILNAAGQSVTLTGAATIFNTATFSLNNTGAISIGTHGSEQNITFETQNFDVNSTGTVTIDGTNFTYTPTGTYTVAPGSTYTVDASGTVSIDSDASATLSGAGVNLTSDGASAITLTYAAAGGTFQLTDGITRLEVADNGDVVLGDDGATTFIDGSLITLSGNTLITGIITETLTDNSSDALDIQEGTNNYININTTNAAEAIQFGNAITNPSYSFLGTGLTTLGGNLTTTGNILPSANDTYDLGSDSFRWRDIWLGGETIHIGASDADETEIGYNSTSNVFSMQSTGNVALQPTSGNVGIGTTNPLGLLDVLAQTSGSDQTPCQTAVPGAITSAAGDFNAGYKFTVNADGQVTKLWMNVADTNSHTVRLYNSSGTVLASATISGVVNTWVSSNITPVAVTAGNWYFVAVRSSVYSYKFPTGNFPVTTGSITINDSRTSNATNDMPTSPSTTVMYGLADITFNATTGGRFIVTNSGNVGIGTTVPTSLLHINGTPGIGAIAQGIAFGDGDTGIYERGDDQFVYSSGGAEVWVNDTNELTGLKATGTQSAPRIRFAAGGVTIPTYAFQMDQNTGTWNSAADTLQFVTNGTAALTIDSSQRVGIGLSAPTSLLEVLGTAQLHGASGQVGLYVNSSGNVGVGTTNPGAKFVIGSGNVLLGHNTLDNYGGNVDIRYPYAARAANVPAQLFVANSDTSQVADTGGAIDFGGWQVNAPGTPRAFSNARIAGLANSSTLNGGYMTFYTQSGGGDISTATERMRITSTGNVGIGTTAPGTKLNVGAAGVLRLARADNSRYLDLWNDDVGAYLRTYSGASDPLSIQAAGSSAYMTFYTGGTAAGNERIRITSGGDVGIGTTNPTRGRVEILQSSDTNSGGLAVTNSGATGNVRLWIDASNNVRMDSLSTAAGNILLNGAGTGNVGIGTTAPGDKVEIRAPKDSSTVPYLTGLTVSDSTLQATGTGGGIIFSGLYNNTGDYTTGGAIHALKDNGTPNSYGFGMAFNTRVSGGGNTEKMRITSGGNVGIGTTNPGAKLEIGSGQVFLPNGTASAPALSFTNDPNTGFYWSTGINDNILISTGGSLSSTLNSGGFSQRDSNYLRWTSSSDPTSGGDLFLHRDAAAALQLGVDHATTPTGQTIKAHDVTTGTGASLTLNGGTGSVANGAVILQSTSGNVGIGTTAPIASLDVMGSYISFKATDWVGASAGTRLRIATLAATDYSTLQVYKTGDNAYGNLVLQKDGGNVGIGTTNPTQKLDVTGNVKITGALDVTTYINLNGRLDWNGGDARITEGSPANYDLLFQNYDGVSALRDTMVLKSSGNVGIGTTAPGTNLDVRSSGADVANYVSVGNSDSTEFLALYGGQSGNKIPAMYWNSNANRLALGPATATTGTGFSEKVSILTTGNVGIGTTAPGAKLEINADISTSAGDGLIIKNLATTDGGTTTTPNAWLKFYLNSIRNAGMIVAGRDSAYGSAAQADSNLQFYTALDDTNTERMRITAAGNVGIGTTSPGYKLDVNGGVVRLQGASLYIQDSVPTFTTIWTQSSALSSIYTNSTKDFSLGTNNSTNQLYLQSGGNVGIGTTGPDATLEVEKVGDTATLHIDGGNHAYLLVDRGATSREAGVNFQTAGTTLVSMGIEAGDTDMFKIASTGFGAEWLTINTTSGSVGIGTTAPTGMLDVRGDEVRIWTGAGTNTNALSSGELYVEGDMEIDGTLYTSAIAPTGNIIPSANDTYDLGSDSFRWRDIWLGGETIHIGAADADETEIGYNSTSNVFSMQSTGNVALQPTSGNVGIGTTNPGSRLNVYGNKAGMFSSSGTNGSSYYVSSDPVLSVSTDGTDSVNSAAYLNNALFVVGRGNGSSGPLEQLFRVNLSGNVGIGTTGPLAKLHITGSERVDYAASSVDDLNIVLYDTTAYAAGVGAGIGFTGEYNTGSYEQYAAIKGLKANATINDRKGQLAFYTSASSGVTTERVRIDESGNVGIGTTNPGATLNVKGATANQTDQVIVQEYNNSTTKLHLGMFSDAAYIFNNYMYRAGHTTDDATKLSAGITIGPGTISFERAPASATPTRVVSMYIDNTGNVGIGTTAPGGKLGITNSDLSIDRSIQLTQSGARTAANYGMVLDNISTSSTASITKRGLNVTSTGTWDGAGATNYGIYTTVSGGTTDYGIYVTGEDYNYFSGNVGIGTTNPVNLLTLKTSTGGDGLLLQESDSTTSAFKVAAYTQGSVISGYNNGTEVFHVDSTNGGSMYYNLGNVGIGTTANLNQKLVVNGAVAATGGIAVNTGLSGGYLYSDGGTGGVVAAWNIGSYSALGVKGSTITFGTGASAADAVTINTTGNVGIGTTNPGAKLHITGTAIPLFRIDYDSSIPASYYSTIGHGGNVGGVESLGGTQFTSQALNAGENGLGFVFASKIGSANALAKMVIDKSGNVGIGTTGPWGKLDLRDGQFSLTAVDVAQPATGWVGTNVYGRLYALSTTAGGLGIDGLSDTDATGLSFNGMIGSTNPTDTTPAIMFDGGKSSATTIGALGALETVFQVRNWGTPIMTMLGSGNVGIGTTGPGNLLTVGSDAGTSSNAPLTPTLKLQGYNMSTGAVGAGSYGGMILSGNGGYTSGARRFLITNALALTKFAIIRSDDATTDPSLGVAGVLSSGTADFVIDNTGNVGIGTTAPGAKLNILGSGQTFRLTGANDTSAVYQQFMTSGSTGLGYVGVEGSTAGATFTNTIAYATFLSSGASSTALQLGTSGSVKMTILSGGNVGIGTTNPGALTHIYQTGTSLSTPTLYVQDFSLTPAAGKELVKIQGRDNAGDSLLFHVLGNNGAIEAMAIEDDGNVGIGTTNPVSLLDVRGKITITGGVGGAVAAGSGEYGASATNGVEISGRGSTNDLVLANRGGSIALQIPGNTANVSMPGNVGIGTTGPLASLHVVGANQVTGGAYNTYGNLFISSTDAYGIDKGGSISIGGSGNGAAGTNLYTFARIQGKKENASAGDTAGYLAFETDQSAGGLLNERMRITSTGNVGIGTTNPGSLLDINGAATAGISLGIGGTRRWSWSQNVISGSNTIDLQYVPGGESYFQMSISGVAAFTKGNVGIGTTAPGTLLQVGRNALISYSAIGSSILKLSGKQQLGDVNELGLGGDDAVAIPVSAIGNIITAGDAYAKGAIYFATRDVTTNTIPTERMRITSAGNVGIGTTAPGAKLNIQGDGDVLRLTNLTAATALYQSWYASNGTTRTGYFGRGSGDDNDIDLVNLVSGGDIYLTTTGAGDVIINNGNVGIGTAAPQAKLDSVVTSNGTLMQALMLQNSGSGAGTAAGLAFNYGTTAGKAAAYISAPYISTGAGLQFATGGNLVNDGTVKMTILESGNVGIGTVSPAATLDIRPENEASNALRIYRGKTSGYQLDYLTIEDVAGTARFTAANAVGGGIVGQMAFNVAGADRIFIKDTGNVGIGTTNPGAKLDVAGRMQVGVGVVAASPQLIVEGDGASYNAQIALRRANATSATGNIDWVGNTNVIGARIGVNDDVAGAMQFKLGGTGAVGDTKIIIKSDGSVGIGTTNPGAKLDIFGGNARIVNGSNSDILTLGNQSANWEGDIQFLTSNSQTNWRIASNRVVGGALTFTPSTAGGGSTFTTPAVTILNNGSVGIGTTAPGAKLTVAGPKDTTGNVLIYNVPESNQSAGTDNLRIYNAYQAPNYNVTADDGAVLAIGTRGGTPGFLSMVAHGSVYMATDNGKVGIGTTVPTQKLTLNTGQILVGVDGSSGDASLYLRGGASGDKARIKLNHYGTADYTIAVGDTAGKLSLTKTQGGTDGIIIDSSGNVGIGTAAPGRKLQVYGGDILVNNSTTGSASSDGLLIQQSGLVSYIGNQESGDLQLFVDNGASNRIIQLQSGTGNVGIGTTAPVSTLQVQDGGATDKGPTLFLNSNYAAGGTHSTLIMAVDNAAYDSASDARWFRVSDGAILSIGVGNGAGSLTSQVTVLNNGSVGIGTAAPVAPLHLFKNSGASTVVELLRLDPNQAAQAVSAGSKIVFRDIDVYDDAATIEAQRRGATSASNLNFRLRNAATPQMSIMSEGNVGIGTTAPVTKLNVVGTSAALAIQGTEGTTVTDPTIYFSRYSVTDLTKMGAAIRYVYSSASAGPYETGHLTFMTPNDAGEVLLERIRIARGGNVGIGTTAPTQPLDILAAGSASSQIRLSDVATDATTKNAKILLRPYTNANVDFLPLQFVSNSTDNIVRLGGSSGSFNSATMLSFYTAANNNTVTGTERMRIDSAGNVGIGTTNPGAKLEINGQIKITGGTPGANKVLTSDANGLATWETAAVSGANAALSNLASVAINTSLISDTNNTDDLGSDALRWRDLYLGANTLHIGTSTSDEGYMSYTTSSNVLNMQSTGNIALAPTSGSVGIGTTAPAYTLDVAGSSAFGTGAEVMRIAENGYVGIGTTSPTVKLHVVSTADENVVTIADSDGTCTLNPESGGAWSCTSDERLKKDIASLDMSGSLSKIMNLRPVSFQMIQGGDTNYGFIAQEVRNIIPEAVSTFSGGLLGVAEGKFTPYIIGAIQQQQAESIKHATWNTEQFSIANDQISQLGLGLNGNAQTIAELEIDINQQLNIISTQLGGEASKQEDLEAKVADINDQLLSIATLQSQIDDIKTQNETILSFLSVTEGVYDLKEGILKAAGIDVSGQLEAGGVVAGAFTVKTVEDKPQTIGTAFICPVGYKGDDCADEDATNLDGQLVSVDTAVGAVSAITATAKIFINFENNPEAYSWTEKETDEAGAYTGKFKIRLDKETTTPVKVNWWIVESR